MRIRPIRYVTYQLTNSYDKTVSFNSTLSTCCLQDLPLFRHLQPKILSKSVKIMGGQVSGGLKGPTLKPMEDLAAIGDDDEYWDFLFSRQILINSKHGRFEGVGPGLKKVYQRHPGTLKQMVRLGTVRLIDFVHRMELNTFEDFEGCVLQTHTISVLIVYALLNLMSDHDDCLSFLSTVYDDCGPVGESMAKVFTKLLFINIPCWFVDPRDDGSFNQLRITFVEALLLLKLMRVQFIEFPNDAFAASIVNGILCYWDPSRRSSLSDVDLHLKLLEISLCLNMWLGISVINRPELQNSFSVNSLELEDPSFIATFGVPLLFEYLYMATSEQLASLPLSFIEILLHATDLWRVCGSVKVCVLMIARVCQVPEVMKLLNEPCSRYPSPIPVHGASWGSVLLEVVVRATNIGNRRKLAKIVAVIACLLLRGIKEFAFVALTDFFELLATQGDVETQNMVVKTVHWVLSRGVWNSPVLAVQMLRQGQFLESVKQKTPEFPECEQLQIWLAAQNDKLKAIKTNFVLKELVDLLSIPSNCCEVRSVSDEPCDIPFDFKAFYQEVSWICPSDHFEERHNCTFGCGSFL